MTYSTQQDDIVDANAQTSARTHDSSCSDDLDVEDISSSVKTLLGSVRTWFTDLGELLNAEAVLSVASLNRLFLLSILIAQAIVLFVIFAFVLMGLALYQTLHFGALELSAAGLVATTIMVLVLRKLMRNTRRRLFPTATINQFKSGLSGVMSALKSEVEASNAKAQDEHKQTDTSA